MKYVLNELSLKTRKSTRTRTLTQKSPDFNSRLKSIVYNYTVFCFFENRVSKGKDLFYYLGIKNNKIRPKAD